MKKMIASLLAAVMLLALCACNSVEPNPVEPAPQQTPSVEATENETVDAPDPETSEAPAQSAFELAESCLDKSVEELYQLIGEPDSADYAPSCLNPGVGEDGNLYYDGFVVYTYREGDSETVQYVEATE